jgi:hypothetical protein
MESMMKLIFKFISVLCFAISINSQADQLIGDIIFEGYPVTKFETNGIESIEHVLGSSDGMEYKVQITKQGENFYWATKGNVQLHPVISGVYVTYIAINGAGYVRTYSEQMMRLYNSLPETQKQTELTYMEHLTHQIGTITYYGR